MGIAERREREKQELRTKILDAARELFVAHGYEAVTMRKIAEKIEYSPTAIYLHFADKDALIRELCVNDFTSLAAKFVSIVQLDDPFERLTRAAHAYVEFGLAHPVQYRLMFMVPPPWGKDEMPKDLAIEKGNPSEDAYAFLTVAVKDLIDRKMLRPELTDVHLVSQALWSGIHGVVALHVAHARGRDDPWIDWRSARKTAEVVIDAMVRGMGRAPRKKRR